MESIISKIINEVFETTDFEIEKRLMGGRSNSTYVIKVSDELYTIRIPGKNGHLFVDRNYEKDNLKAVNELRINNETVYFNVETGVKISRFIEGIDLGQCDLDKYYASVAELLHKVHNSQKFKNDYNPFDRLAKYESFCHDLNYEQPDIYYDLKGWLLNKKSWLTDIEKVTCHNDTQASNFIVGEDDVLYLTDWEFAGNNDRYYDIACFGDLDFKRALKLLSYYEKNVEDDHTKRVYLWRIFQMLQWCNVAAYKHLIGLSKDLCIDFDKVSASYIDQASKLISEYEKLFNT